MKKIFLIVLALFLFNSMSVFSQHQIDSTEINASVPELFAFHDVIYLIWHEAYPSKDISALKGFTDKIKIDMEKINNAKLPGILKDKEDKWKEGLKILNESAERYYKSAQGNDDQAMLDAAEDIHAKFEMMVRIIKPVVKEVDEYHKDLYTLYHKFFPDKNYGEMSAIVDVMIVKAEACVNAKLPKRLESKTETYKKTAEELVELTKALKSALEKGVPAEIDSAVDKMHSKYQDVEKLFD